MNSEARAGTVQLGIDVGGTFTDFILVNDRGDLHVGKHLTTGEDPSRGVLEGSEEVLADAGLGFEQVQRLVHGTTIATNTIIARKGATVGMLTTRGFRDTLDIMEKVKYDIYDLLIDYPTPLIPRRLRREIGERLTKDGAVLEAPDLDEVRRAVVDLLREGAEALVVCFLHSYKFPEHERRVSDLIRREYPGVTVGCSSEICPDIGEFMRFSTASINLYVRPRIERYLSHLEMEARARGFKGNCYMMLSTGATADFTLARLLPIRLIESGPAAGALAAAYYGNLAGIRNLISFDMGGTTAKACVIDDGTPAINYDHFEVARVHRFKKGSGIPLKAQAIDMIEIGAGGGSIARMDELGFLKVGPDSAEADPGPACYARGGEEPTVTDANLMLGYLDAGYFLGGKMKLDRDRAARAIERLAAQMGLDPLRAAWGIHEVVSESMAAATRTHLLEQGRDARKYALFAFGGSGPGHCCRVAANLGVSTVICAFGAGTLSALGLLVAPMAFDFVDTDVSLLDAIDTRRINAFFADAEARGRQMLAEAGVDPATVEITRFADLRYSGQGYEVGVRLRPGPIDADSRAVISRLFNEEYARLYGRVDPENVIETVNWRLLASAPAGEIRLRHGGLPDGSPPRQARKGSRPVYFPEHAGYVDTPVYDRYALGPGARVGGPAVIEEKESTVVLIPGWQGRIDEFHNLVMEGRR